MTRFYGDWRSSCFAGSPYNRMVAHYEGGALRQADDRQGGPPEKPYFPLEIWRFSPSRISGDAGRHSPWSCRWRGLSPRIGARGVACWPRSAYISALAARGIGAGLRRPLRPPRLKPSGGKPGPQSGVAHHLEKQTVPQAAPLPDAFRNLGSFSRRAGRSKT